MPERESNRPQRWLIVEDDSLIAMLVQDAVEKMGLTAIGPAARVAQALQLLSQAAPEAALLDVNLGGETVYAVADELTLRNIPFVFLTGYDEGDLPAEFRHHPAIRKPFTPSQIQVAIDQFRGPGA